LGFKRGIPSEVVGIFYEKILKKLVVSGRWPEMSGRAGGILNCERAGCGFGRFLMTVHYANMWWDHARKNAGNWHGKKNEWEVKS
jgi:hypothetical protein